jgi:hypothetical protein
LSVFLPLACWLPEAESKQTAIDLRVGHCAAPIVANGHASHRFPLARRQCHPPQVVDYIERQAEHHRTMSFQEEFRRICQKHEIEIDERYVWD